MSSGNAVASAESQGMVDPGRASAPDAGPAPRASPQQFGKYQLVRKLAVGGMAEVFLARAAGPFGFEKTLVVKRILPHLVEDPEFVQMFLSEAKLAAQLNHHNIVQIFDFGVIDGAYFIAMEHIDGLNLRALSNKLDEAKVRRAVPFTLCARIVAQACEGLAYAHDLVNAATGEPLNLVHRDISPDNIMLTRTGGVKVVDFGIAKAASQMHRTRTGIVKGKVLYMPPEQLHNKPLDRRADVYALGVVLYNLATAQAPYEADSDISLMHAILLDAPVKARERRDDLPEELERIIDQAMEKDVAHRYQSCLELQADLERYLSSCGAVVGSAQIAELVREVGSPEGSAPLKGVTVRQRVTPASGRVEVPEPSRKVETAGQAEPEGRLTRADAVPAGPPALGRLKWLMAAVPALAAVVAGAALLMRDAPAAEGAAPPTAGREPARLVVISEPLDAQVRVEWSGGKRDGTTPLTVELPRDAEARLRITKPGYLPLAAVVLADASKSYTAKLTAAPAAPPAPVDTHHVKKTQEPVKKAGREAPIGVIDITGDLERK